VWKATKEGWHAAWKRTRERRRRMGKEKGRVHRKSERGKARGGEGRRRKKSEWRKKQKGAGGKKGELAGQRRLGRV
jgi:hypothetical protein